MSGVGSRFIFSTPNTNTRLNRPASMAQMALYRATDDEAQAPSVRVVETNRRSSGATSRPNGPTCSWLTNKDGEQEPTQMPSISFAIFRRP